MKVELLCSWGGHLQEMLEIQEAWSRYDHEIITYESERARAMSDTEPMLIIYPPWKSIPRFLWGLAKAAVRVTFNRPDVLISTGMGWVDIVIFPICKILGTYTIYIESGGNVDYISGTGNFVRRFADRFLVRWEGLAQEIGAEYRGGVI